MLPELSPLAFVAGLLLVYAALAIAFTFVFKSTVRGAAVAARPDAAPQSSAFAKLTDQAVQASTRGVRGQRHADS